MGKMFFNILVAFAGFEVDLLRMRTREGMAVARAKGKLRGKRPKLSPKQQRELVRMADTGEYTTPTSPSCSACPARRSTAAGSSAPGDTILTGIPTRQPRGVRQITARSV
jgi:DNA invertase Pin-like site-specific DNA recombinase